MHLLGRGDHWAELQTSVRTRNFANFRKHYVATLVYFVAVNRVFGKLYLANLACLMPVNVLTSVYMLIGSDQHLGNRFIVYFWIVYFCNYLFVMHLLLAQCTKCIHRPGKRLLRIAAMPDDGGSRPRMGIRCRIGIDSCIAVVHTKKKYGFTYGPFGLVSMMAFTKVCDLRFTLMNFLLTNLIDFQYLLLYGEFMMSCYQLMRN